MRIQWFFLSLVAFVFFEVIQASEESGSIKESKDKISVNQVEPFFFHLLDSFLFKNFKNNNEAALKSDFSLAIKLFKNFPLQTLKVINSFGCRAFIFFFVALISSDGSKSSNTRYRSET